MKDGSDGADLPASHSLDEVGEFGLIDRLAGLVSSTSAVVGIGDDAAVIDTGGTDYLLATVDMVVENVHFDLRYTEPRLVGRQALSINISDIAAMGGEPSFALVSLALPPACSIRVLEEIYEGLAHEASLTGTGIVGGNATRTSGPLSIDVTVLGRVPREEVVLRSGGRPGDVLAVTGSLGAAAARRMAMRGDLKNDPVVQAIFDQLPGTPVPRVTAARRLAQGRLAHAMMDLSDGIAGDIRHMCRAGKVGAEIWVDQLPISTATRTTAAALGVSPLLLALSGGEDYELLVAMSPNAVEAARQAVGDVPLTVIGEVVVAGEGVTIRIGSGPRQPLTASGWTHF